MELYNYSVACPACGQGQTPQPVCQSLDGQRNAGHRPHLHPLRVRVAASAAVHRQGGREMTADTTDRIFAAVLGLLLAALATGLILLFCTCAPRIVLDPGNIHVEGNAPNIVQPQGGRIGGNDCTPLTASNVQWFRAVIDTANGKLRLYFHANSPDDEVWECVVPARRMR